MKNEKKVQPTELTKLFEEVAKDFKCHLAEDASETANEIFSTAITLKTFVDKLPIDDAAKVYFLDMLTIIEDDAGYLYEVIR